MAAKKVRTGAESKTLILDAGAKLASKHGAKNVTRRMVAASAKVAESLVTHYVGGAADAQKLYARRARSMGLTLPTEERANAIGKRLRAHKPGDARDTRKRSAKERVAVAKKSAGVAKAKAAGTATPRKPAPAQNKALPGPAQNKSAAREPMPAPVSIPALPEVVTIPALPL